MDSFFPFIHKIKKKKNDELLPLYVELYPPPPKEKEEDKEESKIIVIEL